MIYTASVCKHIGYCSPTKVINISFDNVDQKDSFWFAISKDDNLCPKTDYNTL